MGYAQTLQQRRRCFIKIAATVARSFSPPQLVAPKSSPQAKHLKRRGRRSCTSEGMPGMVTAAVTSSKFLTRPVPASCVPFCTPKQIGVVPNGLPAIDTPAFLLVTYVDQREDG